MTGWLLDTNILSELRRLRPEPKVLAFVASQPLDLLYISTVTLAEIRFGIELVPDALRDRERAVVENAERAYTRMVNRWRQNGPRKVTGASRRT